MPMSISCAMSTDLAYAKPNVYTVMHTKRLLSVYLFEHGPSKSRAVSVNFMRLDALLLIGWMNPFVTFNIIIVCSNEIYELYFKNKKSMNNARPKEAQPKREFSQDTTRYRGYTLVLVRRGNGLN